MSAPASGEPVRLVSRPPTDSLRLGAALRLRVSDGPLPSGDRFAPGRCLAFLAAALLASVLVLSACAEAASNGADGTLVIGGIPDQRVSTLERQFELMAEYLERETGLNVRYVSSNDYAAIVSAFRRGDVQLAWFGGLTGVQARSVVPGAEAIAQRPRDAEFHSVFIVGDGVDATALSDLRGLSFTFGSESSTSGHLMPRFFLRQAGIDADDDLDGPPGYSGSHDRTYKLVESGAFAAGALNEAVWEAAVRDGRVDTSKVRVLLRSPAYADYHWTIRPDIDDQLGDGAAERIVRALLELTAFAGEDERELLELFQTDAFVPAANDGYDSIRDVAEELGIIRR